MALSKERLFLNSLSLKPVKRCTVLSEASNRVCRICFGYIQRGDEYRGDARRIAHEKCFQRRCREVTK